MTRLNLAATVFSASLLAFTGSAAAGHAQGHGHGQGHGYSHGYGKSYHYGGAAADVQSKARLGVAISAIPLAELDNLGIEYGVRVTEVLSGSAADSAGVRRGDVITAIADRPAYSPERLRHLVQTSEESATVALQRAETALKVLAEFASPVEAAGNAVLGLRVQPMTRDLQEAFGVDDGRGVLVAQVESDSGAGSAGMTAGDILVSVDGEPVGNIGDIRRALADRAPGGTVEVELVRERQPQNLSITLSAAPSQAKAGAAHPKVGNGAYGHGYHPHLGMMKKHGCNMRRSLYRS